MSKNEKLTDKQAVEIVENFMHLISWISSTLTFWNMDTIFPCNIIKQVLDDNYKYLEKKLEK